MFDDRQVRGEHTRSGDLMKCGMTPGCDVCTAWIIHGITPHHSETCRRLIEPHMRHDEDSIVQQSDDNTCQRIADTVKEHDGNAVITKLQGHNKLQAISRPRAHQDDPSSCTRVRLRLIAVHTSYIKHTHTMTYRCWTYISIPGGTSWLCDQPQVKEESA